MSQALYPNKTRVKVIGYWAQHYGRVGTVLALEGRDEAMVAFSDGSWGMYGLDELRVVGRVEKTQ